MKQTEIKRLKKIGHQLHPLVTVSDNGLTENVITEINRALDDHELIKISVKVADRDAKKAMIEAAATQTGATIVQTVGHVALLFKAANKPNPRLSNLLRHL